MSGIRDDLAALNAARWRVATGLTAAVVVLYFGFILLVAFGGSLLAAPVADGLSVGILLGALVIVAAWALTWIYARWANRHYDERIRTLRGRRS